MIVYNQIPFLKLLRQTAFMINGSISRQISLIMKDKSFRHYPASGIWDWNEKVEIAQVREFANNWMHSISDVGSVTRQFN